MREMRERYLQSVTPLEPHTRPLHLGGGIEVHDARLATLRTVFDERSMLATPFVDRDRPYLTAERTRQIHGGA